MQDKQIIIGITAGSYDLFHAGHAISLKQAKSQCMPSSREINSLEKQSPGIRPLFLSQKIEQKEPETKKEEEKTTKTPEIRKPSTRGTTKKTTTSTKVIVEEIDNKLIEKI